MLARTKITKGGKISIPSACRKYLNLRDGQEIIFDAKDGAVVIYPISFALEKARKLVNKYHDPNTSLVDKLIAERRKEAENE
jgi:AbrB family looped-hinge helix DNA binding protein